MRFADVQQVAGLTLLNVAAPGKLRFPTITVRKKNLAANAIPICAQGTRARIRKNIQFNILESDTLVSLCRGKHVLLL